MGTHAVPLHRLKKTTTSRFRNAEAAGRHTDGTRLTDTPPHTPMTSWWTDYLFDCLDCLPTAIRKTLLKGAKTGQGVASDIALGCKPSPNPNPLRFERL
jgi:hypothetical protein